MALLLMILSAGLATGASAAQIENATGPAVVIGSDGLGLVAYQDLANRDLMVAHCVDAACSAVTTSTVDSAGDVGARAAMVLRPGGLPVISYEDATNQGIKLAFCSDAVCSSASILVIDSNLPYGGSGHTGLAIGGDGRPLVAYSWRIAPSPSSVGRLRVVHCDNAGCTATTTTDLVAANNEISLGIAGDGRGVMVSSVLTGESNSDVMFWHCDDVACTSVTSGGALRIRADARTAESPHFPLLHEEEHPSLAVGPDGLPFYAYANGSESSPTWHSLIVVRCLDHACGTFTTTQLGAYTGHTALVINATGHPRIVAAGPEGFLFPPYEELRLHACNDATCASQQDTCLAPWGVRPSLALDGGGQPLVAFELGARVEVIRPGTCQPTITSGTDVSVNEFDPPAVLGMPFTVRIAPPPTTPLTVAYATVDGTAQAGSDYVATSGILTFAPGEVSRPVPVPLIPDNETEPNETFELVLSPLGGTPVADLRAVGTILDDDPPPQPTVSVGDCAATEGNAGTIGCVFDVRLTHTFPEDVTVGYSTVDGTATAPDYIAQSGTLTFAPGTMEQTISVSVVGDVAPEPDEFFRLLLSSPINALPGDMSGTGSILDDDWAVLPGLELSHGSSIVADFQPDPGPVADRDDYRIAQAPIASYEVVMDAVSGDAAPNARLERIAADGTTVLDVGEPVGTGTAVALRFVNGLTVAVTTQYVRVVGAACGTSCGPDDTYRIRAYETTGRIPRFNNTGSQTTVLIFQNTTDRAVLSDVYFWDPTGEPVATQSLLIQPHGTAVLNTANVSTVAGSSGSITVTHNGSYGALAGKAVALEPATGFSFDSPMVPRLR